MPADISTGLRNQLAADPGLFYGMKYDAETRRGFWVQVDSINLLVITITNLPEAAVPAIRAAIAQQDATGDPDKILAILGAQKITRN